MTSKHALLMATYLIAACSDPSVRGTTLARPEGGIDASADGSRTTFDASTDAAAGADSGAGMDSSAHRDAAARTDSGVSAAGHAGMEEDAGSARDAGTIVDGGRDSGTSSDAGLVADGGGDVSLSCADENLGTSACRYLASDGTATITRIETAPATINRCERDPVRVRFEFEPDDPASLRCAQDDQFSADARWFFTVAGGKAPPKACIDEASIAEGSRLRVRRRDIVSGACTPVVFVFDSALVAACVERCFE